MSKKRQTVLLINVLGLTLNSCFASLSTYVRYAVNSQQMTNSDFGVYWLLPLWKETYQENYNFAQYYSF